MIIKYQKYDALVFVIHLEKHLKKTQESSLRINILIYVKSYMKVVKSLIFTEENKLYIL
jgi:hypothetical protein